MSEPRNNPSLDANDRAVPAASGSPWLMLASMLILIAGFLLAGVLLVRHAMEKSGPDGKAPFSLSGLIDTVRTDSESRSRHLPSEGPAPTATGPAPASPLRIASLFGAKSGEHDRKPVRWPKLKLTGFGKSSDAEEGFAIINNHHVLLNQTINDVRVVEIRAHDVVVEYEGERKSLTMADP